MDSTQEMIPKIPSVSGWEEVKIKTHNEKLVLINGVRPDKLIVIPKYFEMGVPGAMKECYVREMVMNVLLLAAAKLPEGYKLVIWDGYRPEQVQRYLFETLKETYRKSMPNLSEEELIERTQRYYSLPSLDVKKPSPHLTGASVDVTLLDDAGNVLNMGTEFDEMTERSGTRFFEERLEAGLILNSEEERALKNRRILYHAMTLSGFTNYNEEWWHYDFGNQFWGKVTNQDAFYGKATK